jgi:hypothetical protein
MRDYRCIAGAALVAILGVASMAGCGAGSGATPTQEGEEPTGEPTPTGEVGQPTADWEADGQVADGEYARQATIAGVSLWWRNDAESLYLAMEAPSTGWVALGLDPEDRMMGANFIFGMVVDGETTIWDAYGTTPAGPDHPPDEELGGTSDIEVYAGVEEDGKTRLEVKIPLDSGDEFDKPLVPGRSYPVIAAYGTSDSFTASHPSREQGEIILD